MRSVAPAGDFAVAAVLMLPRFSVWGLFFVFFLLHKVMWIAIKTYLFLVILFYLFLMESFRNTELEEAVYHCNSMPLCLFNRLYCSPLKFFVFLCVCVCVLVLEAFPPNRS